MYNFFVQNESIHSYGTRSATKIHIEFKRTNYAKFSLKYKGATMWNSLPVDIKNIDSFNRFKKGLKLYIQNQPCFFISFHLFSLINLVMKSRTNIV